MQIPYRASSNFTRFRAWFRLVPLVSTFAESYKLQHFGLVPCWFHMCPQSQNRTNYKTLAWFQVGSTWLHNRRTMHITTLWLGSATLPHSQNDAHCNTWAWPHLVPLSQNHANYSTLAWHRWVPHSQNHANYNTLAWSWAWFWLVPVGSALRAVEALAAKCHPPLACSSGA